MALSGFNAILKYIVLVFNLLFWLAGVGILAIAVWLRLDWANYVKVHDDLETYCTGTYILIGTGTAMTLVGFFGCCGAYRESQGMLGTFFTFLLLIFSVEVAAGIWAYVHKDELYKMVEEKLLISVQTEYNRNPAKSEALDMVQKELGCCGARGYQDWARSAFNIGPDVLKEQVLPNYGPGLYGETTKFNVPRSCCKPNARDDLCTSKFQLVEKTKLEAIFTEGCARKLEEHLMEKLGVVSGIGIGIAVIEVLGMISSLVLCCALRRERFKI